MEASSPKSLDIARIGPKTLECPIHGDHTANGVRLPGGREIWAECPACVADRKAKDLRRNADERSSNLRSKWDRMGLQSWIPARLLGSTFDTYKTLTQAQTEAKQIVREYAEGFGEHQKTGASLILSGRPGTGKGHLAAAVVHALEPYRVPVYTSCLDMIRSIRGTWGRDATCRELDLIRELESCDLLILDEIGVQYGSDGEQTILFDVIDRRYRSMKPTIFITNQNRAGFTQAIGDRSYDRLKETARWVPFDWESYRPTARKEAGL